MQLDRVAPPFLRILGLDHHVSKSARHLSRNHIKHLVVGIVTYGRSIHTIARTGIVHLELRRTIERVPPLPPIYQIGGMENWHARKHREGGAHQIVIVPPTTNGGIGIASLKNGIIKLILAQGIFRKNSIIPFIYNGREHRPILGFACITAFSIRGHRKATGHTYK